MVKSEEDPKGEPPRCLSWEQLLDDVCLLRKCVSQGSSRGVTSRRSNLHLYPHLHLCLSTSMDIYICISMSIPVQIPTSVQRDRGA